MTTIEHALPVPLLHDDILTLYALSGTGATPTHLVNYGGAWVLLRIYQVGFYTHKTPFFSGRTGCLGEH
jgi:hypothetical protein